MHRPTQASREATSSSDEEAPPDDVVRFTQGDVRNGNMRHKQRPLGTATMATAGHGDDHGWEAGSYAPSPLRVASSTGNGHLQITLRGFLSRFAQTTPTLSGTNSRYVA
jgi:hypothetical protein